MKPNIYVQVDYDTYKSIEAQLTPACPAGHKDHPYCPSCNSRMHISIEKSHSSSVKDDVFYHNSLRLNLGEFVIEIQGPLVKQPMMAQVAETPNVAGAGSVQEAGTSSEHIPVVSINDKTSCIVCGRRVQKGVTEPYEHAPDVADAAEEVVKKQHSPECRTGLDACTCGAAEANGCCVLCDKPLDAEKGQVKFGTGAERFAHATCTEKWSRQ